MSYQGVISRESGDPVGTGDDQIPAVAGAMAFAKKRSAAYVNAGNAARR